MSDSITLPYPTITEIEDGDRAVASLWNSRYDEIDENFAAITEQVNSNISAIESGANSAVTAISVSGTTLTYTSGGGASTALTTQDTDVTQTASTSDADYPVLISTGTGSTLTGECLFSTGVTVNPADSNVTASGGFVGDLTGNADSASRLETARTIITDLTSTSTASFNGTANITPGVSGILKVANGGTGASSLSDITVGAATAATQDGSGNVITDTYVTNTDLSSTLGDYVLSSDLDEITETEVDSLF